VLILIEICQYIPILIKIKKKGDTSQEDPHTFQTTSVNTVTMVALVTKLTRIPEAAVVTKVSCVPWF